MTAPPPNLPPPPPRSSAPTSDERTMALLIHLGLIIAPIVSLIVWLIKRENSPFIEHHGKQALIFFVTSTVTVVVVLVLCFFCVGFLLLPVFLIFHLLLPIFAAIAANRGEYYRYPLIGRLIH